PLARPLVISIVLYLRNRGFVPYEDLSNATLPIKPAPPRRELELIATPATTSAVAVTRTRLIACYVSLGVAVALLIGRPAALNDVIDYRITAARAKQIAATWSKPFRMTFAAPVEGFRAWARTSPQGDAASPTGFDGTAATYLLHQHLSMKALIEVMNSR